MVRELIGMSWAEPSGGSCFAMCERSMVDDEVL